VKTVEGTTSSYYGLVLDDATYLEIDGNKATEVPAVLMATADGKVETVKVAKDTSISTLKGSVVKYSLNKGVYTLTPVSAGDKVSSVTEIKNGSINLTTTDGKVKYASDSTLFVLADFDKEDKPTGTVTTYTGYKNVPTYDNGLTGKAWAVDTDSTADGIANVVFVSANVTASNADEYVYVKGTYSNTADGWAYDVIIKGEETTLSVNEDELSTLTEGMYKAITVKNGDIQGTPEKADAVYGMRNFGGILTTYKWENNKWVSTGSAKVADDAPVYYIDTTDHTAGETMTAADLGSDMIEATKDQNGKFVDQFFVVTNEKSEVVAIYILQK
jgi:hypothetical protein